MRAASMALAGVLVALALAVWSPWGVEEVTTPAPEEFATEPSGLSASELEGSACRELAAVAAGLAERAPTAAAFLRELGRRVAGIRPPPRAYGDLARGGRDEIAGGGFRRRFDDGTRGQARHFAGVAVAVGLGGGSATRLISVFARDDPPDSPDGRLTDEAIEFATAILNGELGVAEAPQSLLDRLCRRR